MNFLVISSITRCVWNSLQLLLRSISLLLTLSLRTPATLNKAKFSPTTNVVVVPLEIMVKGSWQSYLLFIWFHLISLILSDLSQTQTHFFKMLSSFWPRFPNTLYFIGIQHNYSAFLWSSLVSWCCCHPSSCFSCSTYKKGPLCVYQFTKDNDVYFEFHFSLFFFFC